MGSHESDQIKSIDHTTFASFHPSSALINVIRPMVPHSYPTFAFPFVLLLSSLSLSPKAHVSCDRRPLLVLFNGIGPLPG